MAVVLPVAHRARVDAKYTIVRQSAAELGSWGLEWAKRNLETQEADDSCILYNYVDTLLGYTGEDAEGDVDPASGDSNWAAGGINTLTGNDTFGVAECRITGTANHINYTVQDIMSQAKHLKNPFNGLSYFHETNNGKPLTPGDPSWTPGDLRLADWAVNGAPGGGGSYIDNTGRSSGDLIDYYFIFHGTGATGSDDFYAGMDNDELANLRQGVFMTQLQVP